MPNFPASLDAAIHPGPGTFQDDPGFELDVLVSQIYDIAVALENKLGISASVPGASAAVLRRSATGASAWAQIQTVDIATGGQIGKLQLSYTKGDDTIFGGASPGALPITPAPVHGAQSFNVDDANSIIAISVRGGIIASHTTTVEAGTFLYVDGTRRANLGSGFSQVSNQFLISVQGTVFITGLSATSHSVAAYLGGNAGALAYSRSTSFPDYEGIQIQVVEYKR